MNKKLKLFTVATLVISMMVSTGCSILFKKEKPVEENVAKIETPDTSIEEDKKVHEMVEKYFTTLFSKPVSTYDQNTVNGTIPEDIKPLIAKRTIDEANGNPEIGIHLPRIIEVNGLNVIEYELLKDANGNTKIDTHFIGKTGENFLYYVRLDLKAKVLSEADFEKYYTQNQQTKLYEKNPNAVIDDNLCDFIKIQLKYDLEVTKEENDYKIVTHKEANYKPGLKNRLFKLNNEFVERITYLDVNIEEEKKIFESEKEVIENFFKNLVLLDRERMILLKGKYDVNSGEFANFLNLIGVSKKDGNDLMLIDDNYKKKFTYESFPLQVNMEKINEFKTIDVKIHPGYSEKNKRYFVSLEASVIQANGMVGEEVVYAYDYYVTVRNNNGKILVDGIELNEYYKK
ncbi:MAG TPA: hypothetical protein PK604_07605 [Acetivibrio clariflavus]|nr:hypothetical protein [Acetivibrio clariflavus]